MAGQLGFLILVQMPQRVCLRAFMRSHQIPLVTRLVGWLRYALDRRVLRLRVAGAGNIGDGNNANQLLQRNKIRACRLGDGKTSFLSN
jgi:hypothetical protein